MGKQLPNQLLSGLIKSSIQTGKVCSTWATSCTETGRDSVMHSTMLKQKYDPTVNTYIWNQQQFPFTERTFGSNVLKATLWSSALTRTLALSSAALREHVTGLHFNRWSSLWLSRIETKPMLLSMKQDLQQIDEKCKNTFYFWSGPRGFEVTLLPPDKGPHNPSCCKGNLSKMLATWKLTAKFPPVSLWTRPEAKIWFPTKCLKIIFSRGKKKKEWIVLLYFLSKAVTKHFVLDWGQSQLKNFQFPHMSSWSSGTVLADTCRC